MLDLSLHSNNIMDKVGPELIDVPGKKNITSLASFFPLNLTKEIGFETLLTNQASSDFFFRLAKKDFNFQKLDRFKRFGELVKLNPNWEKIKLLLNAWKQNGTIFNKCIDEIWFEFDLIKNMSNYIPSCFVGLSEGSEVRDIVNLFDALENIFHKDDTEGYIKDKLRSFLNLIPDNKRIYHLGVMLSRKTEAVRIVISRIKTYEDLISVLKKISWKGNYQLLDNIIKMFIDTFDYFIADFDVGEFVYPKIGIEFYFDKLKQPPDKRWLEVFRKLEENGYACKEKISALNNFVGKTEDTSLLQIKYLRVINHIKFNISQKDITAKAYYGSFIR